MLNAEHQTRTGEEGRRRLEDEPTQGYPPVSAEFPGREPSAILHPVGGQALEDTPSPPPHMSRFRTGFFS